MSKFNQKFSRAKSKFATVEAALASVLKSNPEVTADQLQPAHKESSYYWELIEAANQDVESKPTFTVKKTTEYTLAIATQQAMEHFDTRESNITVVDENDKEIVFKRIRG